MRVSAAHIAFGLLAWLPACRNRAFESCSHDTAMGCVSATTDVTTTAPPASDADDQAAPSNVTSPTTVTPPSGAPLNPTSSAPPQAGASSIEPDIATNERDGGGDLATSNAPSQPAPVASNESGPSDATTEPADTSAPVAPPPAVTYGESLLTNGDFSDGNDFWSVELISGGGFVVPQFDDETLCITARGGTHVVVGWPEDARDSVALPRGHYQFSFRARGKGIHLWAKVGHAYEPYDILFEREWTVDETGWHDVVHEFDVAGDDAAGVAFNIDLTSTADTLCFDEVALRRAITGDASAQ